MSRTPFCTFAMTSRQVEGSDDKTMDSGQKAVNSEKKALILWTVVASDGAKDVLEG